MKVVALLSGGKDSCFNVMHCIANGHEVVAVANLFSEIHGDKEESDSFMYQTVGSNAVVPLVAECLGLPLFRRCIRGAAVSVAMDYSEDAGDEVEDLKQLLETVLAEMPDIEAVSVGAILSNYQRIRVEHVCSRLGLTVLAYLWQANQSILLNSMIDCGLHAVLAKVASIGLDTRHLGKSLAEMQPLLEKLSDRFGCHVCGEGGEYETITLDCPVFKKRIVLEGPETIIHSNDAGAIVAYLKFGPKTMRIEDKSENEIGMYEELRQQLLDFGARNYVQAADVIGMVRKCAVVAAVDDVVLDLETQSDEEPNVPSVRLIGGYLAVGGVRSVKDVASATVELDAQSIMDQIGVELHKNGMTWSDVVMMQLFVADMNDFGVVNAVYGSYFGINPPTRVTVEVGFHARDSCRIQADCLAFKNVENTEIKRKVNKSVMHVQGISYWAPSNIGPYSQTVKLNDHLFVAGQIGLIPNQMALPSFSLLCTDLSQLLAECLICFNNIDSIARVQGVSFPGEDLGLFLCFVRCKEYLGVVKRFCENRIEGFDKLPSLFLAVNKLPRSCAVEFQVQFQSPQDLGVVRDDEDGECASNHLPTTPETSQQSKSLRLGASFVEIRTKGWTRGSLACVTIQCTLDVGNAVDAATLSACLSEVAPMVTAASAQYAVSPVALRVFHLKGIPRSLLKREVARHFGDEGPSFSYVPVNALGAGNGFLAVNAVFPHRVQ
ncbi:hypothetical protein BC830DRAFT_1128392 [Chytriomyces sp. MP71]|nr:hypothetical protein BC830DRAFT_1128392 [Chytriomyces sp. MP71]